MSNICYYSLTGINYKNQFITSCAINSDRLVKFSETVIPSQVYNSQNFKDLRKKLHDGDWPPGCHLCEKIEETPNTRSMRQDYLFENGKFAYEEDNFVYDYYDPSTGFMNPKGCKHIEMRFSNACNMSCLHCSSVFSTGWQKKLETYETDEEDKNHKLVQLLDTMHLFGDEDKKRLGLNLNDIKKICEDLNNNFPNINRVEISGGEVLIQRQFYRFLELLSNHPNRKNITVSFYSNFNADFDIEQLTKLLSNFGRSVISISIDSSENIYPYFRDGNWGVLKNNISKFRNINTFTELGGIITFSAYQFMDIYNVYKSIIPLNFSFIKTVLVQSPKYLNPCVLLFDYEKELKRDFEETYKMIYDLYEHRVNNIELFKDVNIGVHIEKRETGQEKEQTEVGMRGNFLKGEYVFSDLDSCLWYLNNVKNYIFNKKNSTYADYNAFLIYIKKSDKLTKQNFNDYYTKFKYVEEEIIRG
jgi:MoaA/NifB/PqqE/SkfB family radical SAM enzyme